ncbi:MAG: c-type cytochrome [Chitinophagales bacterium]|nr:c-type cytochrome [Chitinophagales bacterium]
MAKYYLNALWLLSVALLPLLVNSCEHESIEPEPDNDTLKAYLTEIAGSVQRNGTPAAGRDYLLYGDFVDHGVPYNIYTLAFGSSGDGNLLERTGDNANIRHDYTAITAPNGLRIVSPNCLQCHAQMLNGQLVVGLGNSVADFTNDQSESVAAVDALITNLYGTDSPQWDAYAPFRRGILAIAPNIKQKVRGVNSADNIAAVLAAHRNRHTLEWQEEPTIQYPNEVVPVDVPAWWQLRKKNSMFWTALGRGDYAKISMASSLLTLVDTAKARQVNGQFGDVEAYINTLEPPTYPQNINADLAAQGKTLFIANCQRCHGTYGGETETYPNLLVSLDLVKTDPMLAVDGMSFTEFVDWYNESWFNTEPFPAYLTPHNGYIAPPLDGVWATAPYLHNGSVPTLDDLLNSTQRPNAWKRTFNTSDIDYEKVGWNYSLEAAGSGNPEIYDCTVPGYHNTGHTFGDRLNTQERAAVIEYLKTL